MELDGTGWNWMELDGTGWNWMELDGLATDCERSIGFILAIGGRPVGTPRAERDLARATDRDGALGTTAGRGSTRQGGSAHP
jgi:hypothetical protein